MTTTSQEATAMELLSDRWEIRRGEAVRIPLNSWTSTTGAGTYASREEAQHVANVLAAFNARNGAAR